MFLFAILGLMATTGVCRDLKVGMVYKFNDKFAGTIIHFDRGVETAKHLFQKDFPDTKIELKKFSHEDGLKTLVPIAKEIEVAGISAVIGPENSTEADFLSQELGEKGTIVMSPTATNPDLSKHANFFRVCFSDDQVADGLARYVVEHLKPNVIGVLKNISMPYSQYLSDRFAEKVVAYSEAIGKKPPTLVVQETITGSRNFSTQIARFKESKADLVAGLLLDRDFAALVRQARGVNYFPTYLGSDGWGSNEYVYQRYVKDSSLGNYFKAYRNNYWKEEQGSGLAGRFRSAFRKEFAVEPNAYNAIAFDAAWVLFTAMRRTTDPNDPALVKKELLKLNDLELVTTDKFSFGPKMAPKKALYIYKIDKLGPHYEATIQ